MGWRCRTALEGKREVEGRRARAAQQSHLLHGPNQHLAPQAPSGEPHFWWRNKQVPLRPTACGEAVPKGLRPRGSPGSRRSREFPVGSRGHPRFASMRPPSAPCTPDAHGEGRGLLESTPGPAAGAPNALSRAPTALREQSGQGDALMGLHLHEGGLCPLPGTAPASPNPLPGATCEGRAGCVARRYGALSSARGLSEAIQVEL